jgi:hypothetical protein
MGVAWEMYRDRSQDRVVWRSQKQCTRGLHWVKGSKWPYGFWQERNRKVAPIWDNSRVNPFVQDDSHRNFGMEKDLSLLGYRMSTRVYHSSTSAGACSKPFGHWGLSSPQLIKTSRTTRIPSNRPGQKGMFETGYILELSPWLGDQASNLSLPNFQ